MQNSAFANAMLPFSPGGQTDSAKTEARVAIRKSRRKSWTEVMPRTAWEGGFDEMDEIDEETEGPGMAPVKFDDGYSIGVAAAAEAATALGVNPNAQVHFFADDPRNARAPARSGSASPDSAKSSISIDISTPSTPSCYSDDGLSEPSPSPRPLHKPTVPASILLKKSDFAPKNGRTKAGGAGRRASFQAVAAGLKKAEPLGAGGLRFKTTGGREIVLQSSYEPDEVPFDYAIDLEKGVLQVDASNDGATDGHALSIEGSGGSEALPFHAKAKSIDLNIHRLLFSYREALELV